MSALFEAMSASFGAIFGAVFLDGTLHRATRTDGDGGDVTLVWTDIAIKGQVDQVSEAMRQAAGYTEKEQRLIVLQSAGPITSEDEITLGGQKWAIASVEADPVNSHWIIRGQRAN